MNLGQEWKLLLFQQTVCLQTTVSFCNEIMEKKGLILLIFQVHVLDHYKTAPEIS